MSIKYGRGRKLVRLFNIKTRDVSYEKEELSDQEGKKYEKRHISNLYIFKI